VVSQFESFAESVRLLDELGNRFVRYFLLCFERIDAVIQACDQCDRLVKRSGNVSGCQQVVVNVPARK